VPAYVPPTLASELTPVLVIVNTPVAGFNVESIAVPPTISIVPAVVIVSVFALSEKVIEVTVPPPEAPAVIAVILPCRSTVMFRDKHMHQNQKCLH
jgi:hypothetical protein